MSRKLQYALLAVLGLLWLVPLYLVLVNAVKPGIGFNPNTVWIPSGEFAFVDNVVQALDSSGFGRGVVSTALYSVASPALSVLVGAAAGFGIVALRLRHGLVWFVVIFAGTIFPLQMLLMPLFVGYARSGLFDTRGGMILIYTALGIPFAAFLMRNFFSGIARSVFEAAVIDGATSWRIFSRIYLPMASSALVAVFILQAVSVWNDLLLGLVLTQSPDARPIMTALTGLQSVYGDATPPVLLAGALVASFPTIAIFLAAQRFFSRGLSLGQFT
jgi:multiple sugar transport system permease protein